jgi:S1-C subfamily serine protease
MKPNLKNYYGSIVRIIAHDLGYDWLLPFQKQNSKESTGSGFFIDDEGHIMTCSHCVEDAVHIFVEIPSEGNKQYSVVVKGVCPFFDLAILQIQDYKNKSFCELDDGQTIIEPGLETFALGYPLGQDNMKITKGIISGQQYNFYQTDTPINPGNSGGPLLYNNKVIGINAAGIPANEGEGIGYCVPIQRFYNVQSMLFDKKQKLIHYPQYFGFEQIQNTTKNMKTFFGNNCEKGGVYIRDIIANSPVTQTDIRKGDILCKINGIQIDYYGGLEKRWMNESMSFENLLSEVGINKKVTIDYWRKNKLMSDTFKLKPFLPNVRLWYPVLENIDYECIGGLILMNMNINLIMILKNNDLHKYLNYNKIMEEHVIVVNVIVGGQIAEMDIIRKGDLLSSVNDKKVNNLLDFRKHFDTRNKFIKIETNTNKLLILDKKTLKKDDTMIRKRYNYKPSKLFKKL